MCRSESQPDRQQYKESDYIQEASEGTYFGKDTLLRYRYRVLGRDGLPTHHDNNLKRARKWFHKCREKWVKEDHARE